VPDSFQERFERKFKAILETKYKWSSREALQAFSDAYYATREDERRDLEQKYGEKQRALRYGNLHNGILLCPNCNTKTYHKMVERVDSFAVTVRCVNCEKTREESYHAILQSMEVLA
jgi:hypothetical protein